MRVILSLYCMVLLSIASFASRTHHHMIFVLFADCPHLADRSLYLYSKYVYMSVQLTPKTFLWVEHEACVLYDDPAIDRFLLYYILYIISCECFLYCSCHSYYCYYCTEVKLISVVNIASLLCL